MARRRVPLSLRHRHGWPAGRGASQATRRARRRRQGAPRAAAAAVSTRGRVRSTTPSQRNAARARGDPHGRGGPPAAMPLTTPSADAGRASRTLERGRRARFGGDHGSPPHHPARRAHRSIRPRMARMPLAGRRRPETLAVGTCQAATRSRPPGSRRLLRWRVPPTPRHSARRAAATVGGARAGARTRAPPRPFRRLRGRPGEVVVRGVDVVLVGACCAEGQQQQNQHGRPCLSAHHDCRGSTRPWAAQRSGCNAPCSRAQIANVVAEYTPRVTTSC